MSQVHFAPEMWGVSGNKKRIRPGAVPTLFPNEPKRMTREHEKAFVRRIRVVCIIFL